MSEARRDSPDTIFVRGCREDRHPVHSRGLRAVPSGDAGCQESAALSCVVLGDIKLTPRFRLGVGAMRPW